MNQLRSQGGPSLEGRLRRLELRYARIMLIKKIIIVGLVLAMTGLGAIIGASWLTQWWAAGYVGGAGLCVLSWLVVLRARCTTQGGHAQRRIRRQDWLKHFESQVDSLRALGAYECSLGAALQGEQTSALAQTHPWHKILRLEGNAVLKIARRQLRPWLGGLVLAMLSCMLGVGLFQHRIYAHAKLALAWLPPFQDTYILEVIAGEATAATASSLTSVAKRYELSARAPALINLYEQNLLRITRHTPRVLRTASSPRFTPPPAPEDYLYLHSWFPEADQQPRSADSNQAHTEVTQSFGRHKVPLARFMARNATFLKEPYQVFVLSPAVQAGRAASQPSSRRPTAGDEMPSFRVAENSALVIPSLSAHQPVAYITLGAPSLPQVGLVWHDATPEASITDHEPIALKISAVSPYPLTQLRLVIQTQGGEFTEKISRILAADQLSIVHNFTTTLRPYVTQHEQHVHLVAEAIAHHPSLAQQEVVGRSEPLALTVVSSYGRYQQTLAAMAVARHELMRWSQASDAAPLEELAELSQTIKTQSQHTPFFHYRDRRELMSLADKLRSKELADSVVREQLMQQVSAFLDRHEAMDQRARDRDFFVAARTYSRKLGAAIDSGLSSEQAQSLEQDSVKMEEFLQARHRSWQQRVAALADSADTYNLLTSNHRDMITGEHFTQAWQQMHDALPLSQAARDGSASPQEEPQQWLAAQARLAEIMGEYQEWLEDLERAEDGVREHMRMRHSQTLSQVAQRLMRLRQSQDEIGLQLDPLWHQMPNQIMSQQNNDELAASGQHPESHPAPEWDGIRLKQLTAMSQAKAIKELLAELPNPQDDRLNQAIAAMAQVVEMGDVHNYQHAELMADRASRLLREGAAAAHQQRAQLGAQRSARQRSTRGGDDYYGTAVVDFQIGDAEHVVHANYRQKILDQMSAAADDEAYQTLNSRYLREILR